jgi:hypothetical protein
MKALTVEQFEQADDLGAEWFPLPAAFGDDAGVFIRNMRADESAAMEDDVLGEDVPVDTFRRAVLLTAVVDEKNEPIFNEETIDVLMAKSRKTVQSLFDKACELNGLTKEDVDELEKNSESTQDE